MLSCTSSDTLTRGKYQRVPQNLDNPKNGRVEHWVTYPTVQFIVVFQTVIVNYFSSLFERYHTALKQYEVEMF